MASEMTERDFMALAVEEAAKCKAEDGQHRPLVAAVVVKDGQILATAYRGELGPGDHAEYTALEKKIAAAGGNAAGATVYTTLEPCTTRNHPKQACAHRLIANRVDRVVIGMLDPNPNILGRGVLHLRQAGIAVEFFPRDLMAQLEAMNRKFTEAHGATLLAPAITDELLATLREQSLDDWYTLLNRIYWNRNSQRGAAAIFSHLVEVIGGLSSLVSKKKERGAKVQKTIAKALAWWIALCGHVGVESVSDMLWSKFPSVCPYCHNDRHAPDECAEKKLANKGPDWVRLQQIANERMQHRPKTIAGWQKMFGTIYSPDINEDFAPTFAKLTEEVGELAEALRVFPAAPGYFLSEAADVFAWLMKLNNVVARHESVPLDRRGEALEAEFASAYPRRCLDCNAAICTCPPILGSTIGRIAHEVAPERSGFAPGGSFMTPAQTAKRFGPRKT